MSTEKKPRKRVIGRIEKVSLPDIDFIDVEAKIDTGAYRSAIHHESAILMTKNNEHYLQVLFQEGGTPVVYRNFEQTAVKSSNGTVEERYIIKTTMLIGGQSYKTEFTLGNRKVMKYSILLGRKFLSKRFTVDVSKKCIL